MKHKKLMSVLILAVLAMLVPNAAFASGEALGDQLPLWSMIPFAGCSSLRYLPNC